MYRRDLAYLVSIPYRFNERFSLLTFRLFFGPFQFLIGSMKARILGRRSVGFDRFNSL
ncbi:MAG: hypothetical protein JETT_0423 [Candidatus Jettenia ecosi]|uniref:Uncharacterized protein n=1 Tax=Candidatus Jettenia ecosi TaxID=2494326 RepID=A0A533QF10_9BACT|nr:MAG: hypothetical protein JETT_0423 [Candidatus Jettenia ecosi]